MHRRSFLRVSGAAGATVALAGIAAAPSLVRGASAPRPQHPVPFSLRRVGVQLYTVRNVLAQHPERTLAQLRSAGYTIVETAGLPPGTSATSFRAMLDRTGVRSPSGHYPLDQLETRFADVLTAAVTLGQRFIVLPFLPPQTRPSRDAYASIADRLNAVGERARAAGVRFAYHNHDFEFATFGAATPAFDILLHRTDPTLVSFELDTFWVFRAGYDPNHYLARHPERFTLCHLKDGTRPPAPRMVEVGAGAIDFRRLLGLAAAAGLQYGYVEHDDAADPLASVRASREYLHRLLDG